MPMSAEIREILMQREPGAALLMAWATLEAAGRFLEPGLASRGLSPRSLVDLLVSNGHVLQPEGAELRRLGDQRNALARGYIDGNIGAYPLLSARHLTLDSTRTDPTSGVFSVTVHYDLSDMPLFAMPSIVPTPPTSVVRSAAIQRGGY